VDQEGNQVIFGSKGQCSGVQNWVRQTVHLMFEVTAADLVVFDAYSVVDAYLVVGANWVVDIYLVVDVHSVVDVYWVDVYLAEVYLAELLDRSRIRHLYVEEHLLYTRLTLEHLQS